MRSIFSHPSDRIRQALTGLVIVLVLAIVILLAALIRGIRTPGAAEPPPRAALPATVTHVRTETPAPTLDPTPQPSLTPTVIVPTRTLPPLTVDIDALLAQMSLEQKAGQRIMAVLPGEDVDETAADLVRGRQIGGFILYDVNVSGAEQVRQLAAGLQGLVSSRPPSIPLLIAVDNEGGRGHLFGSDLTRFPSQMALGAAGDLDLAYRAALASAREQRALGINLNFRPVLDINDNPYNPVGGLRAFGDSPERVAEFGAAAIQGLLDGGVIPVVKHFPGHGDTDVDSHDALPIIDLPLETLEGRELLPYRRALQLQVPGIMVGHIANRTLDPRAVPATLSRPLNSSLLRGRLAYQGVVFTDALTMSPIRQNYPVEVAAVRAAEAGSDVLLFTNPSDAVVAQQALMGAVQSGRLSAAEFDQSVRRILEMKARAGLLGDGAGSLPGAPDAALTAEHQALSREIARRAIYAQGEAAYPLLKGGRVLLFTPDALHKGSPDAEKRSLLGELLAQRGVQVDEWIYPLNEPSRAVAMREDALRQMDGVDMVILVTFDGRLERYHRQNDSQERMAESFYARGVPVILIAAASPYDLLMAPAGQPALATFGDDPAQLEALAAALFAAQPPPGVLPVTLK